MNPRTTLLPILAALALTAAAHAQSIDWRTIDCGGSTSTGGTLTLSGTIGQPDAGGLFTGGTFTLNGGYWAGVFCTADFNNSGSVNVQDIFDFLAAWFVSDPRADFNGVNGINVQDIFDFLAAWFRGCD